MPKPYVPVRQDAQKLRYIEWLTTPPNARQPETEAEIAAELDVHAKTLYNWRHDREFKEVWHDMVDEVAAPEDVRQRIMENLARIASDPDNPRCVVAAKTYFDNLRRMSPGGDDGGQAVKAVGMLTDDELARLIDHGIAEGAV
jgi:hypothetical protein